MAHLKDDDEVALDKAYYVLSGGVDVLIRDSARNVSARSVHAPHLRIKYRLWRIGVDADASHGVSQIECCLALIWRGI